MKTKRFRKWCAIFIPTLVIIFFFAGFLFAPNDPMKSNLLERYADPSAEYPFGTDALGRCILSRILYGGWTTLGIVLGGSLIVFLLGTVIGMVTSRAVMKENALIDGLINAVTAIPPIAYLIVFIGAWGSGAKTTLVALTVSYILRYIKLVRTRTDMEMGKAYVMCAIASGASKLRIMLIHIFPNLIAEMIRFLCLSCADMILAITGFSFIGLGLGDNVVDWGSMILDARGALVLHPTMILYPIGAVILSTLCFNVIDNEGGRVMLKIEQLDVKERSGRYLLKDISMEIPAGHVIGLTGKSGSGKTTLLRSILGMLHTSCHIDAGKILLDDIDLSHLSRKSHRELCGKKLGFIPQNPMTAFDSRLKIGYQMRETFVNRLHLNTSEATDLAKEKLVSVNLKDTDRILGAYPSELSGGMLQRVAAAILLGMSPDYVLADEPTAALDEENRDLLLLIMQEQMKDKGILFVSHDVAALKNLCQNVYVLGAGKIIEHGTMDKLLSSPQTDWMKQFSALSHRESRGEWKWEKL